MDFDKLLHRHTEIKAALSQLAQELEQTEKMIKTYLCEEGHYDLLSINWSALARHRAKYC